MSGERVTIGGRSVSLVMLGWIVAGLTLLLDQASKVWFMITVGGALFQPPATFSSGPSIEVLPIFNLTLVWNQGMSYGLLQADSAWGRYAYIAFAFAIVPILGWWMSKSRHWAMAVGLGLIIGGAVGNNWIDRLAYHAVVDFLHFHIGQFHWYVFNVADAAIVFGVMLLIWDAFWGTEQPSPAPDA